MSVVSVFSSNFYQDGENVELFVLIKQLLNSASNYSEISEYVAFVE